MIRSGGHELIPPVGDERAYVLHGNLRSEAIAGGRREKGIQRCFFTNSQAESSWNSWPPSKMRC